MYGTARQAADSKIKRKKKMHEFRFTIMAYKQQENIPVVVAINIDIVFEVTDVVACFLPGSS